MFQRFVNYIKNSVAELKKVVWPTKRETIKHTVLVIVISLTIAVFLGLVDFILTRGLQLVLK